MALDLNRITSFMGKDRDVTNKLLIGGAVSLIPIVNFASMGYGLNMFRNVLRGNEDSEVLPDWSDFGGHFMQGLMLFLIGLGYMFVPMTIAGFAVVPVVMAAISGREEAFVASLAGSLGLLSVAGILAFLLWILSFMGTALYGETGSLGSAFSFGEILRRITASLGDYALILVILFIGSMAVSIAAGMVPFIGAILAVPLMFPLQLMGWYAMGRLFREHFPAG